MRWLQWSTIDLANGLGGVEVHARSLHRELESLGHLPAFSTAPRALDDPEWDVIHTHGSAPLPSLHPLVRNRWGRRPILVHTLHGQTIGRMIACSEFTWPGGYLAASREAFGVVVSDVVLGVHADLSLLRLAKRLGKITDVCSNGWDSSLGASALAPELDHRLSGHLPFWLFIGRGGDRVKGADLLENAFPLLPELKWVAAPGDGFESSPEVIKTGRLDPSQILSLLTLAEGLVLPSRYEGLPLVVLEALAAGLPVAATAVGGLRALEMDNSVIGLVQIDFQSPRAIADGIRAAGKLSRDARAQRAEGNRRALPTWKSVAEKCVAAVLRAREGARA